MMDSEINYDIWLQLDQELRKDAEKWAALMAEALSKDDDPDVSKYEALARAAKSSHKAFFEQWEKTIGNITHAADIAEELKEDSGHFRKPTTLIRHAMKATKNEIRQGRRALGITDNYYDWESHIELPPDTLFVIDHAVYAMYVAWNPESRILVPDNRPALLRAMALDESLFRVISPREFEELVAYLYECLGCKVELTKASRDFGADVLAWHGGPLGSESLIAVQVKRYAKRRKVGLKSIFELHGAVSHYSADAGHIVTSSDFTKPARQFAKAQRIHMVNLEKFQEELGRLFKA
jgi:hypothetical protein